MNLEIERKFRVVGDDWRSLANPDYCCQGYLNSDKSRTVRVRTVQTRAWITVKGPACGATRMEFEYELPLQDAQSMLEICERPLIEKNRFRISFDGVLWEVDEFLQENAGLIVAEVELESEQQPLRLPDWVGEEVTGDARYFNSNLVRNPFCQWDRP